MYDWAELRHFRYLLTILELQGFRAAADALHTSQPNLSVQARQFQENASVRLYRKTKSGRIRITDTGFAFMGLARLLLDTRDQVMDALVAIERGEIKTVRFGWSALADPQVFQEFCALHRALLPGCTVRPIYGDTAALATEIVQGHLDAAIVTLPLSNPELHIEMIRQDRLVVCLRQDDPRASKPTLRAADLQHTPVVLYHPDRHPDAHERLVELLEEKGITIQEYSRASHPSEIQSLVKEGYGFALIREGTRLDEQLTTRPLAGANWTVDIAAIYRRVGYPKTVPLVVKQLRSRLGNTAGKQEARISPGGGRSLTTMKRPPQPVRSLPDQLSLLSDSRTDERDSA